MNTTEANKKINFVREKLLEMQNICSFVTSDKFEVDIDTGYQLLEGGEKMRDSYPVENKKLQLSWEDIQKNAPSGFLIDGNLVRHLSFNEACDWLNIHEYDIPRELIKIEEYKKHLHLIEYIETLHPKVSRVSETILSGDIDAALKTVFTSLDVELRMIMRCKHGDNTFPMIGKAFNDGVLAPPHENYKDGVRSFLQGVIGYYRNFLTHNELPTNRNRLEASLSLFALAHETFILLDICSKK